ncbi:hypothetical protein [Zooshikella ganghwensis]|nr:hypothetical protein [Zooshikella ganghwensis]
MTDAVVVGGTLAIGGMVVIVIAGLLIGALVAIADSRVKRPDH